MKTLNEVVRNHELSAEWGHQGVCAEFWPIWRALTRRYYPGQEICYFRCEPMPIRTLVKTAMSCAVACGFTAGDDDAEECAQSFVFKKLQQSQDPVLEGGTEAGRDAVREQALAHARHEFSARKARRAKARSIEVPIYDKSGHRVDLISPESSPESAPIEAELMDRLLAGASGLTQERQRLWFRHVVEGERIVDLQGEFGKSANLLRRWLFTMRRIIRESCEGEGLTEEEIRAYREQLAHLRVL